MNARNVLMGVYGFIDRRHKEFAPQTSSPQTLKLSTHQTMTSGFLKNSTIKKLINMMFNCWNLRKAKRHNNGLHIAHDSCHLFTGPLLVVLLGGSGRARDPTRPTKQTNNNTPHIHYVCCVLLVVLLGGSGRARDPGAKTRRFERRGLSGSRQVIGINSRVQNDAFLIYPNGFGVCVVCVWCVWCVW